MLQDSNKMGLSSSETNCTHLSLNIARGSHVHTNIVILIVLDVFVTIATIIANGLFLVILCKSRRLHVPSNILIGALCWSDLTVGIVAQMFYLMILFLIEGDVIVSDALLNSFHILFTFCSGSSCLIVAVISLDRYTAVSHPYKYRRYATCKTHVFIVTTLCSIWLIFTLSHISNSSAFQNFQYTLFALIFIIILAVIFTYLSIYLIIRKHRRTVPILGRIDGNERRELFRVRREKERSYVMLPIIGIFLLLHLPYLAFSLYFIVWPETVCSDSLLLMYLWDEFFLLLSSLTNPLVYCLQRSEFRTSALRMFSGSN